MATGGTDDTLSSQFGKSVTVNADTPAIEIEYAYHITDRVEALGKPAVELRWSLATDKSFYGLPCLIFSAWPTDMPDHLHSIFIPADRKRGQRYWRVKVPMRKFDKYTICYANFGPITRLQQQSALLLIDNTSSKAISTYNQVNVPNDADQYLRRDEPSGSYVSEYCYKNSDGRLLFAVLDDLKLIDVECVWDVVEIPNDRAMLSCHLAAAVIERTFIESTCQEIINSRPIGNAAMSAQRLIHYAYHVTNVQANEDESNQPDWNELKWSIADDPCYDSHLVGLPCVFFTTSLYNGDLPTLSVYPRNGIKDKRYWRVKIPMSKFDDYSIFYSSQKDRQVRLILTKSPCEHILGKKLADAESKVQRYLRRENTPPYTYYSTDMDKNIDEAVVSFVVLSDFSLDNTCEWDTVRHRYQSSNPNRQFTRNVIADSVIR